MQNKLACNAYSQNQLGVESPQKLVEMLYEGILKFCARAKVYIRNEDIEQRVYYIKRATAIFVELINGLDYEKGGDVAYYLAGLYTREIQLLALANLENNEARVDEVINVAKCLLEAWREVHSEKKQDLA
ncbi:MULTISPECIES: flagellar export chaperone FliS [unclassified Campylobacter]|uniref:flagellar export chaperone FliS n=1 Tax=unclassified Campylobacter TaxID=2593542 RepID=UPI001237DE78|nr:MULTISPECIES: flagellar export chaperone FliS [unclassified Campylobacter]KAA6225376.1 flagellar export chaperone FliS [Campylobacter sp. LR185c]KAA6227072.1 flagellar export chaperone FliS [Campylobacter sp. LR196d]KAA6227643.1 flagellar export chaperone FliS [Campylobacter sp. LR286c]KAA6230752.1 flagellar export chaperone FliS [Campylobacter sp. LR291e]KAA8604933.1 flagellar export chaperone FliS [Campylobacter sp. LR185c]